MVAFVIVALVLNAQFTWWVVYSLRDNRERLDLERSLVESQMWLAATRLQLQLLEAERSISAVPSGVIPVAVSPFVEVRVVDVMEPAHAGAPPAAAGRWVQRNGRLVLDLPLGRGRSALAFLDPQAPYRWLAATDPDLQIVERGTVQEGRPSVHLAAPLDGFSVTPEYRHWKELLRRYRQRVVGVLLEGGAFLAAIVTAVGLLWRAMRREGAYERQHQNFISAVTHELKTPIAGIRLALETVLSGRVDDDGRKRFLGNALADSERLADLVEKVLEVTRYAGGAHRLRMSLGDLSQLVEEEVVAAERRAAARGVTVEADVVPGVQATFDPEAIAIVISNLIENALKYADSGEPRVGIRLAVEGGEAVLEVRDNGVGIAAYELESIFKAFYRAGDEVTRRTPGTGIGLFVAREIVEGHGGKLTASSPGPGRGATLRLALPGAEVLPEDEESEYSGGNETR